MDGTSIMYVCNIVSSKKTKRIFRVSRFFVQFQNITILESEFRMPTFALVLVVVLVADF